MTANVAVIGRDTDYQLPLFAVSVTNNCKKNLVSMTTNNINLYLFIALSAIAIIISCICR